MPQGEHVLPTHSKGSSDLQGHLGVRVIWVLGFRSQPCHLQGDSAESLNLSVPSYLNERG